MQRPSTNAAKKKKKTQSTGARAAQYHAARHHLQKFFKLDFAAAVRVDRGEHLFDLVLADVKAERLHRRLELLQVDGACTGGASSGRATDEMIRR